jgi:hypothetical protein
MNTDHTQAAVNIPSHNTPPATSAPFRGSRTEPATAPARIVLELETFARHGADPDLTQARTPPSKATRAPSA